MPGPTYYQLLEVSENASPEVIKAAYRSLALRWHPDRNQNNLEEASKAMARINRAFETLSDPQRRRLYDAELAEERASGRRVDHTEPRPGPGPGHPSLRAKYAEAVAKTGRIWAFLGGLFLSFFLLGVAVQVDGIERLVGQYRWIALVVPLMVAAWAAGKYVDVRAAKLLAETDDAMLEVLYQESERRKVVHQTVGGVAVVALVAIGIFLFRESPNPTLPAAVPPSRPAAPIGRSTPPTTTRTTPAPPPSPVRDPAVPSPVRVMVDLQVENACDRRIRLAIRYMPSGSTRFVTQSWWEFDAGARQFLSDEGTRVQVPREVQYYAESLDGMKVWRGQTGIEQLPVTVGGRSYQFRVTSLPVLQEGHRLLKLTCS